MPLPSNLLQIEAAAQRVVVRQQAVDLVRQRVEVGQIHQADGAAADLVLIGGADAAAGGADRGAGVGGFAQRVELAMQRQDQRDVLGDAQIVRADGDALAPQLRDLVEKGLRIEHHAVADHRELGRPQHAGRQQRQLVGLAIDDERMAGIVAALEAHDDIGLLRQPVDDLALPLVTPLGADDDNIGHFVTYSLQLSGFEHDLPGKELPAFPDHALACPAKITAGGRSHARQPNRIKEAGRLGKQEGGIWASLEGLQPIDIPGKFVAARRRRWVSGVIWQMSKTTPATKALEKLGVKFVLHTYVYDSERRQHRPAGRRSARRRAVPDAEDADGRGRRQAGLRRGAVGWRSQHEEARRAFGGKAAKMMRPADAERLTGYHVGGISPFGQKKRVPVAIEAAALGHRACSSMAGSAACRSSSIPTTR